MMGWLLLLAALALRGSAEDPDLVCYRNCMQCNFICTWRAKTTPGNATYILKFCYHRTYSCKEFKMASSTHYRFSYRTWPVLENLTAWVESHSGGRVERTQNITLQLENAIKLDPLPPDQITFSKSNGTLRLTLQQLDNWIVTYEPLRREARYRQMKGTKWTQVACQTQGEYKGNNITVICNLGTTTACEVQIRHKMAHWSTYWSDWSKSIFVPEEIPEVNYTVGRLGRNGQRNVTFHWQEAREEQWKVYYTLALYMPACRCTELKKEVPEKDETTLTLALSGAEYHLSMSASNPAGRGPVRTYRIPPEHRTEMSFLNVSSSGSNVTVQWAAKTNGTFYCIEKQPLEDPQEDHKECIHKKLFEKDSYMDTGTVKPRKCYRIAIHGGGPEKHWTFGSMYHFATNTSLDGPIHIRNITANSAFLLWKPSLLSQCPGMLKKYIICYTSEQDNGMAHHEVNSSATHYTLQDLQPSTSYRVGIQAATADRDGSCSPRHLFNTMKLGPNPAEWKLNLRYLSIFLGVPVLAVFYHFLKKRAKKMLFPPLPNPMDSEAIKFPAEEISQVKPRPGFVEPSEKISPTGPLVTKFISDKGEPDMNTETHSLHLYTVTEETAEMLQAKEGQAGSENDLPFEYRRQVLLTPAEEEQEEDDFREFAGVCGQNNLAEAGTGPSQPHPDEGAAMEQTGLSRPLVQLSLLLSDKPVIIKNEGSFDLLHK
ncbi:interleukin-12 receptor subunit beta-1 [Gopherus flavomarginatus]|uniref:interleukin-12 receptor subunit beta-1 n=1 Tax=Gopherus flavomarginatus TaxID=286002 RepID=UPI0021CC38D3|nr:interleukin-12 receptor subunit beta-1 [Gopherus flavomarginatus]